MGLQRIKLLVRYIVRRRGSTYRVSNDDCPAMSVRRKARGLRDVDHPAEGILVEALQDRVSDHDISSRNTHIKQGLHLRFPALKEVFEVGLAPLAHPLAFVVSAVLVREVRGPHDDVDFLVAMDGVADDTLS